ncbi:MAG: DUF1929 domain-containing protein [Myxococcota bacterium]
MLPSVAALALAAPAPAATFQDFDTPGSAYVLSQDHQPPAAQILAGGPTGHFLRLAVAQTANANSIGFDLTDQGVACTATIDFDFRITKPVTGTSGHGIAVDLLDTAQWGPSGAKGCHEDCNLAGALMFGFDTYQGPFATGDPNDNHVSVHYGGSTVAQIDATPAVDLDSGAWLHAQMRVDFANAEVSVDLGPSGGAATTVIDHLAVPGLAPFESRLNMMARSNNQIADHDVDNLSVTYGGSCPAVLGQWGAVQSWPIIAIHSVVMPNGKVMIFDGDAEKEGGVDNRPYLFDPETGTVSLAAPPDMLSTVSMFCGGFSGLEDGRVLISGGMNQLPGVGPPDTQIYDPANDTFTAGPFMNAGRWYPTLATLPNGDIAILGGGISGTGVNTLPQVFETATGTLRDLTTALKGLELYPLIHLAPDGRIFHAGPEFVTNWLDPAGTGAWTFAALTVFPQRRLAGSSIVLEDGRVMNIGGGDPPTGTTETFDWNAPSPTWQSAAPMHYKRRHLDAVLLPDGTVLALGGTGSAGFNDVTDATRSPELYDPATDTWRILGAHSEVRLYHSSTVLLPDGRILAAGGGRPHGGSVDYYHFSAEIYEPPYLFQGPRPTITSAPDRVNYGTGFHVATPDAGQIAKVTMMRLGLATHSTNQGQRIVSLPFTATGGGLDLTAPSSNTVAPPGYWMLFLVDQNGSVSESAMVQLTSQRVPATPPVALVAIALGLVALAAPWLGRRLAKAGAR